ncbi:MAG: hypothetical protein LBB29_03670 [Holosporaceae bacterium]|jgi:phage terminase large subunit-like protein|nr:hypothetical protein [Holosporaceae bacterium]
MNNIVIGVDPAMTNNNESDETGIIVAGMDGFGKAYVLDDLSISATPNAWAKRVVDAYHRYSARLIVVERNAGGDLLENLLRSIDASVKIKTVYAHKSKIARAEPIVILYQKKMIFHARQFQKLETQMATYEPKSPSPDRLDAMVWAMTELFNVSTPTKIQPFVWNL